MNGNGRPVERSVYGKFFFDAYCTSHIATLSEDSSVKCADCAKLKGYYQEWSDAKYLIGFSLFVDLLIPCTVFSKCIQSDMVDTLAALTCVLKTMKETDKLATKPLDKWPTYAATLRKCTEEDGTTVYQCPQLKTYSEALTYYTSKYVEYCGSVSQCIKSRFSW